MNGTIQPERKLVFCPVVPFTDQLQLLEAHVAG